MNSKNKNVMIFLILVIIIFTCFFSITILTKIKKNAKIDSILIQNITNSNWPASVPVIQNKFINISKLGENSWSINIKENVPYEDFKNYLIELYSEGFEPNEEMGSKNPKLLSSTVPDEENFILLWCGASEMYNVEAYWKDIENLEVPEDSVTILLYSNISDNIESNDDVSSEFISGDMFEDADLSGEMTIISGD